MQKYYIVCETRNTTHSFRRITYEWTEVFNTLPEAETVFNQKYRSEEKVKEKKANLINETEDTLNSQSIKVRQKELENPIGNIELNFSIVELNDEQLADDYYISRHFNDWQEKKLG